MDFVCPTCGEHLPRELTVVIPHTEDHIVDAIKKKHPDWTGENGVCAKCYEYYKKQMHTEG